MTLAEYDAFCAALPATIHVVQWGDAHVWKVGGKVFAIARESADEAFAVTFKCSWASYDILKEQPGLRPAPYLASRGMSWIQRQTDEGMSDEVLLDYLRESHRLIAAKLSKRIRAELSLEA
jgi:predicted DNA-binding protein (MmcQ/YjbR family)